MTVLSREHLLHGKFGLYNWLLKTGGVIARRIDGIRSCLSPQENSYSNDFGEMVARQRVDQKTGAVK